ncbi:MAG: hypothetical protein HY036_11380 [Nitrospirae bacterium]|nr:hypothetical protein [Nitrospirota bacterium]MBI3353164.1 hypothetical protein [Nitrospirota bacterium]
MDQPLKPKQKKGKLFFLILIIVSGICVFSLLFLAFEGDKVTVYMIERFVMDQGIFEKELSDEINPEEKKEVILNLHQFFNSAKSSFESKEKVALVGSKLREIMEDKKMTREEVQALESLLKN